MVVFISIHFISEALYFVRHICEGNGNVSVRPGCFRDWLGDGKDGGEGCPLLLCSEVGEGWGCLHYFSHKQES